jgi:tetratricopeptide (TPR) repeat protein
MEKMKKQSFLLHTLPQIRYSLKLAFILVLFCLTITCVHSQTNGEFDQLFKSGQYAKALIALKNSELKDYGSGQISYLEGICHSKLQEYDQAIKSFDKAIALNNGNEDLYYEYGQALYAANELKAARKAFKESSTKKYNTSASLYYVAHISQILEEFPEAKDTYTILIKNKSTDNKTKQITRFQLAETLLSMLKEKTLERSVTEENVDKYIVPMMKEAINTDKNSQVAREIDQRILEILKEYNLDPNLLLNGRRISNKRYNAYISQKIKFDDNVSLTNEENNVQQSKKGSLIFESEVYGKFDFVIKKKFIVSPDIRLNFVKHSNQHDSVVYQNDAFSYFANLKNKYEHLINSQPASFLIDIEYSKTSKDWQLVHSRDAYSKSTTFGIGESFTYFSKGDTTIKLKRKNFIGVNELISNHTTIISADQAVSLISQNILIILVEADMIDNFNNKSSNTNTYLARLDYLIPDLFQKYTLGLAMATTLTDTKEQNATRGTELTLNPSVDISKALNDKTKISLNYDFTKNKSKLSDYDYKKHVITTEFRYSF